jgi:hypothetical protein
MSGNPSSAGSSANIPVILLVHRASADLKQQTHENVIVINSADGTAPEFFQAALEKHKTNAIYGFLSEHDYLATEDAIEHVVRYISNPYIGGAYADNILMAHNNIPQVLPPFSKEVYQHVPINVPLFVPTQSLREWDTSLKSAYFFDYFKKIGHQTLLAHIPHPIIATKYHPTSNEEVSKIVQKYGQR